MVKSGMQRCGRVRSASVWSGWARIFMQKKEIKVKTSFTLLPKIKSLIVILSEKLGVSQTGIVQMAIVKLAEKENVVIKDKNDDV